MKCLSKYIDRFKAAFLISVYLLIICIGAVCLQKWVSPLVTEKVVPYVPVISEAFKKAIGIKPDISEADRLLKGTNDALGRYSEAIRIKRDDLDAYLGIGKAYVDLRRYSKAIEAYKQVIRIKPDFPEAHFLLGNTYFLISQYNEAILAYKQAIRIQPHYAEAYVGLGKIYALLRRHSEAIKAFREAIRIKPGYADAHFYLGITYLHLKDKDMALAQYKILKELDVDKANQLFNSIHS